MSGIKSMIAMRKSSKEPSREFNGRGKITQWRDILRIESRCPFNYTDKLSVYLHATIDKRENI